MSSQTSLTTRRQFLSRSAWGFGSAFILPSLLASCTDHLIDPTNPTSPGDGDDLTLSKGVDFYAYLGNSNFSVLFQKPTDDGKKTTTVSWPGQGGAVNQMLAGNFEIYTSDIGYGSKSGRFASKAYYGGSPISDQYAEINPLTGDLDKSTVGDMMKTPSVTAYPDFCFSYGFYDSGDYKLGNHGLINQNQFYIYATANQKKWMGNLASGNSSVKNAPLNRFVLPGAHDAGMFDSTLAENLAANNSTFRSLLIDALNATLGPLSPADIRRIIINLAITQKDTIATMLDLGIRYFDFRPGYLVNDSQKAGPLYHQHDFIPGDSFTSFLESLCQWLQDNPSEIAVVALGHSGFHSDGMRASPFDLWGSLNTISSNHHVGVGSKPDLASPYIDLISSNKRLIVLGQYGFKTDSTDQTDPLQGIPIWDTSKYDSYNGDSYETKDVNNIINALNGMDPAQQPNYDYTVLQLQGTANAIKGGIFDAITSQSDASSPLMSTKAQFDHQTYPWIQANVPRFAKDQLLVCLNDFADNALTDYCIGLTRQRAEG